MSRHHYGARIHQYLLEGYRCVALENELLRIEVLPDKGSDVISFLHKKSDTDFLWRSTLGLLPASLGIGAKFTDAYEGGWQEILPNGGPGVTYKGAELPFHGETALLPWNLQILEDNPEKVSIELTVRTVRSPYTLTKRLSLASGSNVLQIDESLLNEADTTMDLMWGHHPTFGPPFLDDSCRIDTSARRGSTRRAEPMPTSELEFGVDFDWPNAPLRDGGFSDLSRIPSPDRSSSEWVCLTELEEGWYGITNARQRVGFGLVWDVELFPYLWYWQVWGGWPDYPWYGRHYNCALEPWTSWPDSGLQQAIENGTALQIGPGESIDTRLLAVAYDEVEGINGISKKGRIH